MSEVTPEFAIERVPPRETLDPADIPVPGVTEIEEFVSRLFAILEIEKIPFVESKERGLVAERAAFAFPSS